MSQGLPVNEIASVASFFVSRIDSLVDSKLDTLIEGTTDVARRAKLQSLHGKIAMANQEETKGTTIKQKTFVKAIKRYVLTANNPISVRGPEEPARHEATAISHAALEALYGSWPPSSSSSRYANSQSRFL